MESKRELRQRVREQLQQWPIAHRQQAQTLLIKNLQQFMQARTGIWAAYMALPDEVDISPVFNETSHIQWAFPKVHGEELSFYLAEPQELVSGAFGIQEPDSQHAQLISVDKITGVLIPGRAFNLMGARLGRGKGYYDRALSRYVGLKTGVCFSLQVQKALPQESWDQKMNWLVTEEQIFSLPATTQE